MRHGRSNQVDKANQPAVVIFLNQNGDPVRVLPATPQEDCQGPIQAFESRYLQKPAPKGDGSLRLIRGGKRG